ncbi:hypothetical protein PHLGIDRAFT_130888 [Phlebiopsis gigantea 11061_1 CR5-6]|uniref:Uncharacterized protein n=1 Tax=Phlebiopsis gigantea (strain 11061_1 CR5-6) TaxID=745531 RepID=A0A0C3S320_PHLG1|nr:hypothetical protein PHLGIDRAFT_130888 [Phlebiopsis gigantea 11061_1 CR5-6]
MSARRSLVETTSSKAASSSRCSPAATRAPSCSAAFPWPISSSRTLSSATALLCSLPGSSLISIEKGLDLIRSSSSGFTTS